MIRSGLLTPQMIQQIVTDVKEGMLELHRRHGRKHGNDSEKFKNTATRLKEQLRLRDYSEIENDALAQLEHRNIDIDGTDSPEFTTLCDGMLRAKMRVFEVMAEREDGNLSNGYDDGLVMRTRDRKYRLTELMDDYIIMTGKSWGVRTQSRKDGNFKKILEILGDITTSEITKDLIQILHNELRNYPVNRWKNPYAPLSLEECRKLAEFTTMHPTTFKDTWRDVKALLLFGSENEKYKIARNYAADTAFRIKKDKGQPASNEKRAEYDKTDIECLFRGLAEVNRVRQPHRYWIPLIGLYQGMRLNEICQLYCDDIIIEDGIDCIRITDNMDRKQRLSSDSNLKSVKNAQSRRTIPIHPTLINLGFLDFVATRRKLKYKRIWENLKTPAVDYYEKQGNHSHYMSKWYCGTFRKNYITNNPEQKPFHALRHTFVNWHFQNDKSMDFSAVKGLVGHVDTDEQRMLGALFQAVTWNVYAKELNVQRLLETLSKLDYGVDMGLLEGKPN